MTEIRWLDEEEQRAWRAFLFATRLLFGQFERDLQQSAEIPLAYYEILSTLSEAPNRALRMSELAAVLHVSLSRVSHAVSRLEQLAWVRREMCPSDRRGWSAVLTDSGFAALETFAPAHVVSVREHLLDPLSPTQLEQLRQISETLLDHLSTIDGSAGGSEGTFDDRGPEQCS